MAKSKTHRKSVHRSVKKRRHVNKNRNMLPKPHPGLRNKATYIDVGDKPLIDSLMANAIDIFGTEEAGKQPELLADIQFDGDIYGVLYSKLLSQPKHGEDYYGGVISYKGKTYFTLWVEMPHPETAVGGFIVNCGFQGPATDEMRDEFIAKVAEKIIPHVFRSEPEVLEGILAYNLRIEMFDEYSIRITG